MRRLPDDPPRARQPDRHAVVPEGGGPGARAVHGHRDRRVEEHRGVRRSTPASSRRSKVKVVYLGAPLDEFSRARGPAEIAAARARARARRRAISRSAPSRACTTPRATSIWSTPPASCSTRGRDARFFLVGEGPLRAGLEAQAARLGPRRSLRVRRVREGRGRDAVGLRPERVPVALGRHAAHRVRGARGRQAHRRHRRRRPARHPAPRPRRAHRARSATPRALADQIVALMDAPGRARAPRGQRPA
ncbi:MAG: hypothetical protein MZV64_73470 [Ignavibacteriales bacterium]|nr:hypothetical protein [Ignavibacteriales bacterium]